MCKKSSLEKLERAREVSILGLGEKYLSGLCRKGRCWMTKCPFHDENTPSFAIYPDTNSYYCFGCMKSGDVITFVREMEGCSFREAVTLLNDNV